MEATHLIPLVGKRGAGMHAAIDAADEPLTRGYRWSLGSGGYVRGHRHTGGARHAVQLHVLICGTDKIDHKDGDKLNCRRGNLRPATRSQNNSNRRGWSRCGFKGVRKFAGKYTARIQVDGRCVHLGTHDTAEDAARAYDAAAAKLHGEFARLNFSAEARASA